MEWRVRTDSKRRRRSVAAVSAVLGGVLMLTACGGGDEDVVWYSADTPPDAGDVITNCEITKVVGTTTP